MNNIKEDPARLIEYNNRAKQIRDEAETPTVGIMVTERPVVKKYRQQSPETLPTQNTRTQTKRKRNLQDKDNKGSDLEQSGPEDSGLEETDDEKEESAPNSPEDTDNKDSELKSSDNDEEREEPFGENLLGRYIQIQENITCCKI